MKHPKALAFILKLIFTILILVIILNKIDIELIYVTLASPKPRFLIISILLCIPNFILKFYKWHYLLRSCKIDSNIWIASKSYLAGLSFGLITPARVGEIGRSIFLKGQDKLQGAGVTIVDKIVDLMGIMLLSLAGAKIFLDQSTFFLIFFFVVSGGVTLMGSKAVKARLKPFLSRNRLGKKMIDVLSAFDNLSIRVLLVSILCTLMMFSVILLQCYTLIMTFHTGPLPFMVILFAFPLVILANIIPITIGGFGVREGVAIFCLGIFNVPGEVAFTATFYLFLINVLTPAIIGYVIILGTKMNYA